MNALTERRGPQYQRMEGASISWGPTVNRWNRLSLEQKREQRAVCLVVGHDYRVTTLNACMCFRCCDWIEG